MWKSLLLDGYSQILQINNNTGDKEDVFCPNHCYIESVMRPSRDCNDMLVVICSNEPWYLPSRHLNVSDTSEV